MRTSAADPASPDVTVAFLGLGTMGGPMAANIARAGFPTTVWNRSPGKSGTAEQAGATVASSAADSVSGAAVVVTMLTGVTVVVVALTYFPALALGPRGSPDPAGTAGSRRPRRWARW